MQKGGLNLLIDDNIYCEISFKFYRTRTGAVLWLTGRLALLIDDDIYIQTNGQTDREKNWVSNKVSN